MTKNLAIVLLLAIIIALPFALRQEPRATAWRPGNPILVIVTPHNEGIRYEFGQAFSRWHAEKFGEPVKIEWRAIGGTTEIMRYLASEYAQAIKAWWTRTLKKPWPARGADVLTGGKPTDPDELALWNAFRDTDDPDIVSSRIDLFFGGGEFDHSTAFRQGLTVAPWKPGAEPEGLFVDRQTGVELIPAKAGGETWRTPAVFGNVISSFGICSNFDRLRELGFPRTPDQWQDLADPALFRQVGAADPSKSGSVAKAFEMMVHQQIHQAVRKAGFFPEQVTGFEAAIEKHMKQRGPAYQRGELPADVPAAYQDAIERGWLDGIALVQLIGANARYFTESAPRVAIDVSSGDAAAGMSIDFFGRYQAQTSAGPDGKPRMAFITPLGGSSASCDPISLLRGAGGHADAAEGDARRAARLKTRQIAIRFIEFTLREEGQRLWTYRPGTPGGPEKFALRRLPIRRDFYPSTNPVIQARHATHLKYAADDLADPTIDPYVLARTFTYWPRWTASHFGVQRDIIRTMCMDAGDELKGAWRAIIDQRGLLKDPTILDRLKQLPTAELTDRNGGKVKVPLTWRTAPDIARNFDRLEYTRQWTIFFRQNYREIERNIRNGW